MIVSRDQQHPHEAYCSLDDRIVIGSCCDSQCRRVFVKNDRIVKQRRIAQDCYRFEKVAPKGVDFGTLSRRRYAAADPRK